MPAYYPQQQNYLTTQSVAPPSAGYPEPGQSATAPENLPVGPTANEATATAPAPAPVVTVTSITGWKSWSTTKKAVVVGGGVLGLAAAVGILKALVR